MKTINTKTSDVSAMFQQLFNKINRTLSFNKNWHTTNGRITGVINHENYRLILQPGEVVRMTDNFKRKIVLIGTVKGTVAIYQETVGGTGMATISCEEALTPYEKVADFLPPSYSSIKVAYTRKMSSAALAVYINAIIPRPEPIKAEPVVEEFEEAMTQAQKEQDAEEARDELFKESTLAAAYA